MGARAAPEQSQPMARGGNVGARAAPVESQSFKSSPQPGMSGAPNTKRTPAADPAPMPMKKNGTSDDVRSLLLQLNGMQAGLGDISSARGRNDNYVEPPPNAYDQLREVTTSLQKVGQPISMKGGMTGTVDINRVMDATDEDMDEVKNEQMRGKLKVIKADHEGPSPRGPSPRSTMR